METREPQLLTPGQTKEMLKRKANTVDETFYLIFDTDEWSEEQERLNLRLPSRYTLVSCVPQKNGSVQFQTI